MFFLKKGMFIGCMTFLSLVSHGQIDLTSPSSEWNEALSGDNFDVGQDTQAKADVDLVGTGPSGFVCALYCLTDDKGTPADLTDDEIAFRFRADDNVIKKSNYDGTVWIGVDVDLDNDIDLFMQVKGKNGTNTLKVFEAGNGLNTSPSTTTIGNAKDVVTFGTTDFNLSTTASVDGDSGDIDEDGVADYFVSLKVNVEALKAVINTCPLVDGTDPSDNPLIQTLNAGSGFTKEQPLQLTIASSTSDNSFNSDIGGYDGNNDDDSISYADQGALSAPLNASSNHLPVITSHGGERVASVSVNSGRPNVTIITASDLDADPISYSLDGGSDEDLFQIDSTSGALSFITAPTFVEGDDNTYEVIVRSSDPNGGYDLQTTAIIVDEVTPAFGVNVSLDKNILTWTVDWEEAVAYYEVEQLIDDNWKTVKRVAVSDAYSATVEENGTYRVVSVDADGSKDYHSLSEQSIYINLEAGWNLISSPFINSNIDELKERGLTLWSWSNSSYEQVTTVVGTKGYWIYSSEETFGIKITGDTRADNKISLNKGWTLAGPANDCTVSTGIEIYTWDKEAEYVLKDLGKIYPGYGYWFYSDEEQILDLQK